MPKSILLVEDSEDDAFFITRAFKNVGMLAPVAHVADGNKAVDYLSARGPYADRARFPLPALVLLDIKLPFMSGFDVLSWIRQQSNARQLPVVMFTSSNQECDIDKAYLLGANAYLMKPSQGEHYSDLVSLIRRFWLEANLPPPAPAEPAPPAPSATDVKTLSNPEPNTRQDG